MSGPEYRAGGLAIRPRPVVLEYFVRRPFLAPLLFELAEWQAPSQASFSGFLPQQGRPFKVWLTAVGIVCDHIDISHSPFGNEVPGQVVDYRLGVPLERITIARSAAAEPEKHVAFLIDTGGSCYELILPVAVNGRALEDFSMVHRQGRVRLAHSF